MLTALSIAALLGGLPPIGVSLEPGDCPTVPQLSRVLSALGAKLVPFGSPARATVFAQRDASGEWSLTLGRPGSSEKRKVSLSGGCDEQAAALGAIIERFARPVLIAAQREAADAGRPPPSGVADAGVAPTGPDDGWAAPFVIDAGVAPSPRPEIAPPPPPPESARAAPPPPPAPGVAEEPAPEPEPPPPPPPPAKVYAVGIRGGAAGSWMGVEATAGLWADLRWPHFSLGLAFDYLGPMRVPGSFGVPSNLVDVFRPHLMLRWRLVPYFGLELAGGVGIARAHNVSFGFTPDPSFHPCLAAGLFVIIPIGPIDLWVEARGWAWATFDDTIPFHEVDGELTSGVSVNF